MPHFSRFQTTNLRKPNRKPSGSLDKTAKINDVGVPKPSQTFAQTCHFFDKPYGKRSNLGPALCFFQNSKKSSGYDIFRILGGRPDLAWVGLTLLRSARPGSGSGSGIARPDTDLDADPRPARPCPARPSPGPDLGIDFDRVPDLDPDPDLDSDPRTRTRTRTRTSTLTSTPTSTWNRFQGRSLRHVLASSKTSPKLAFCRLEEFVAV